MSIMDSHPHPSLARGNAAGSSLFDHETNNKPVIVNASAASTTNVENAAQSPSASHSHQNHLQQHPNHPHPHQFVDSSPVYHHPFRTITPTSAESNNKIFDPQPQSKSSTPTTQQQSVIFLSLFSFPLFHKYTPSPSRRPEVRFLAWWWSIVHKWHDFLLAAPWAQWFGGRRWSMIRKAQMAWSRVMAEGRWSMSVRARVCIISQVTEWLILRAVNLESPFSISLQNHRMNLDTLGNYQTSARSLTVPRLSLPIPVTSSKASYLWGASLAERLLIDIICPE